MTLFEEIFLDIEGEQEITPIQIKENKGRVPTLTTWWRQFRVWRVETLNIGDAMVFIDIGCPIINGGCKSYVINEMFRNVLGTSLGEFNLKTEGYDFYELGTGLNYY